MDVEVRIQVYKKQKTPLNVIQVGQSGGRGNFLLIQTQNTQKNVKHSINQQKRSKSARAQAMNKKMYNRQKTRNM